MGDDALVNTLSQYLDLEPVEKQALLEQGDVAGRSRALIDLIEMHAFAARTGRPGRSHAPPRRSA